VKRGGLLIYNDTLIQTLLERDDVQVIKIPASQIASDLGNLQVANMVAVGGLAEALGIVSFASLAKGLMRVIPQYRHHLLPLNKEAIRKGIESARMSLTAGT
jgi:2-oxoglutarate ferredoxin oxidoreductase subunit gamma